MNSQNYDLIIVGGGLAGSLLLKALQVRHPHLRYLLIEKNQNLGGNHTWCFHEADLPESCRSWLSDLVSKTWDQYEVQFPDYSRQFKTSYHSFVAADLSDKIRKQYPQSLLLGQGVEKVELKDGCELTLENGQKIRAETLVSARGWKSAQTPSAWQKFVGLDVELTEPHGLTHPLLMDAKVAQIDGFRFFQLLPFNDRRVLVEDNYYSHHSGLKTDRIEQEILHYVAKKNWIVNRVIDRSTGALPLIFDLPAANQENLAEIPRIGAESGFFHPVAGLTVPTLFRQIEAITEKSNLTMPSIYRALSAVENEAKVRLRFYRLLNRVLFRASAPAQRYKVLSHFYRMPDSLIQRFYAGQTNFFDQCRLCLGRPPVPWSKALRVLREGSA